MRCWSSCFLDDDASDVRVVHADATASTLIQRKRRVPRGHPHAVVDTVTDHPDPESGGTAAPGPALTTGLAARRPAGTPASTSASRTSFDPPRPSGRNRSPARAGANGSRPSPTRRRRTPRTTARRATPPAARARSRPRSRSRRTRHGPATATAPVAAARASRSPTRWSRAPTRSTRRPPGSSTARRSPRATASTASTVADDGGGAPSHWRTTRVAQRAAAGRRARRRRRLRARPRATFEELVVVAQHRRPGARARRRGRGRAPRSRRGMTSRRSHTRRWWSSSFIGSCTGASPRRAQSSRVSARRTFEQRPANPSAPLRHAREPGGRAPAEQRQQHGLGLVVARVADEDRHGSDLVGRTRSSAA